MIWVIAAMMAVAAGLGVLWPLGSGKTERTGRAAKAMAIYEDQLAELDRDADRGLITAQEARAAQVEIKRRMLAVGSTAAQPARSRTGSNAVVIAALFVPLAAFGLYNKVGAPDIPAVPLASRGDEQQEARQLNTLTAELRSRLEADPDGGETRGWELLASTYMNMGRPAEAAAAYKRLTVRPDATSATFSQYAEALITAEGGIVTKPASDAIAMAAELDADNPAATYYRAIELDQAGQTARAHQLLVDRIARAPAPAPWMPTFLATANQMGATLGLQAEAMPQFPDQPGPTQEDIEAAADMTPDERQAFVRSMVDGLASRLEDEPEDLDGWLQLARALVVLGEQDRAYDALKSAEPLIADLPEDDQRRRLVETGLERFGNDG